MLATIVRSRPIIFLLAAAAVSACSRRSGENIGAGATGAASGTVSQPSDSMAAVRGTITSVSTSDMSVQTSNGVVAVKLAQPLQVFAREPSSLDSVKDNTFIGVTTVKQPDGSEQATEIHIFPEALRGLGEGSRMMGAPGMNSPSRMTNGSVSSGQGAASSTSPSRMSNGSVASTSGSTMVVQYTGGSTTVTVPPTTPVTALDATSKPLGVGDQVVVLVTKQAAGGLSANRVLIAQRAGAPPSP